MEMNYLESVKKQFAYYKLLGEKAMNQLSEEELCWQFNEASNSIAVIVKHLWGNMLSRWTDFLVADGEKEWRDRDGEFEADLQSKEEIMDKWESGWNLLFSALESINTSNFDTTIYIRNQGHTIVEAINRQLAHYAYHIGQMVYVARMIKSDEWKSLSIPKGASKTYNQQKFAQPKRKEHFTKEFLDKQDQEGQ